jgi:hypothetical protein
MNEDLQTKKMHHDFVSSQKSTLIRAISGEDRYAVIAKWIGVIQIKRQKSNVTLNKRLFL